MSRWRSNLLLVFATTIISLVVAEVALRIAGISYLSYWQVDGELGASLRPGVEGWWTREGRAYIRINSAGQRDDREHAIAKPRNTLRIAVLGDSYAEALQVPVEQTFWSVLERELTACPALGGRAVEVINFGVSGYGTAQELLALRQRAWQYDPDVVLLAFVTGNDVRNNSRELEPEKKRPFFSLQGDKLVADFSFRESRWFEFKESWLGRQLYAVWNGSRLMQVLLEAHRVLGARRDEAAPHDVVAVRGERTGASAGKGTTPFAGLAEAGLDANVYLDPQEPAWRDAWQVTDRLLVQMSDEVKGRGAKLLVVTLSSGPQVHPNAAIRRAFEAQLGVEHLFYPDYRVRDLGSERGFAVLNLAPTLQAYAEQHNEYLHGFENSVPGTGHWNSKAHALAGASIAATLCTSLGTAPAPQPARP